MRDEEVKKEFQEGTVATRGLGLERARRQRWLTGLVAGGITVTALAVALAYWTSATRRIAPLHIPPSPAADVNQQLSGYTFTRSDQGRAIFTVHADRTVAYEKSKSTELEGVTVQMFGRKGDRGDVLRTDRCEYNPTTGDFYGAGPVQIELSAHAGDVPGSGEQGKRRVMIETSKVSFHQAEELAETDQPVKFHMGPATGTALGMEYATGEGWVVLRHDVVADLAQGTPRAPRPSIHLTASSLRYDKEGRSLTLSGPVTVSQETRRAVGDNARVSLDDQNHVTQVNLEGHAQAFDDDPLRSIQLSANRVQGDFNPVTGELRHLTAEENVVGETKSKGSTSHMTSQRMEMDLGGKHPEPVRGVATGEVHLTLESQAVLNAPQNAAAQKGVERKVLTAAQVLYEFRPDGHSLKAAETVGPGTLDVSSADPKVGPKIITAGQFLMTFDVRSRIQSLRGTAPTQVGFLPAATSPPGTLEQQSQADHLEAAFDPGTQSLHEVRQSGNFEYHDGDRRASADNAEYDPAAQSLVLLGHPEAWDASSRVKCQKITMDMRTNTSVGEGRVQATHLPAPAPGAAPPATPPLPTNVLADKMVAVKASQTIHYEGHVRAWQGTDVVESTALDVFRTQKRVSSGRDVVTTYLQPASTAGDPGADAQDKAPRPSSQAGTQANGQPHPVTVHADYLDYFDEGRRARYHGNVRLVSDTTTMQSDRLDVYFTQGDSVQGSQVDHAEADGHVKVTQPGRVGTSEHGEYFAVPGKIILTGGPPVLVDEKKGSTTGQRLTFFTHDDRLFVDGGDQSSPLPQHRVAP